MIINLNKLDFQLNAFEPFISSKTMNIHYNILHKNYVNNINLILSKINIDIKYKNIYELTKQIIDINYSKNKLKKNIFDIVKLKNSCLAHLNHSFLWKILINEQTSINNIYDSNFYKQIIKDFGSLEHFIQLLILTSNKLFSNGWCWLIFDLNIKKLKIITTSFHNNPLFLNHNIAILLCIDLWEHAYINDYGLNNLRSGYIKNLVNFINWKKIENLFEKIKNIKKKENFIKQFNILLKN